MRHARYFQPTRRCASGLLPLSLALLLTGCASAPPEVTTRTELVAPPAPLMANTPAPLFPAGALTNLDLVNLLADYQDALGSCNDDKQRLRALFPTPSPSGAPPSSAP
jgi:hypothetical protein